MKVYERFGIPCPQGLIGMEVEVEGNNLPQEIPSYWKVETDNSLRGEAKEYILKRPFDPKSVSKAIDILVKATANSELHFSHRTSVHVHINVCSLTRNQLINFLFISYFFDKTLSRFGGREIKGNRFALRISDAEGQLQLFSKLACKKESWIVPDIQSGKYAAINLAPVRKYGSVEFRSMRGTLDPVVLKNWVSMIVALYNFSLKFSTIKEMMYGFIDNEIEFTKKVFGTLADNFSQEHIVNDLRFNYSLLLDIMFGVEYSEEAKQEVNAPVLDEVKYEKGMMPDGQHHLVVNAPRPGDVNFAGEYLINRKAFPHNIAVAPVHAAHNREVAALKQQFNVLMDEVIVDDPFYINDPF